MKKKLIIIALIALMALSTLSATRLKLTYEGTDYIVNTTRTVTENDTSYFTGMYDALKNSMNRLRLHEVYDFFKTKNFTDIDTKSYYEAYADFMANYTHGSIGTFNDLYSEYSNLLSEPASYENSALIIELGSARFFSDLI